MTQTATADRIYDIAARTIEAFPKQFRIPALMVQIAVEDFIPPELMEAGEDPWDITGLYTGIPLTLRRDDDFPEEPDTVWLFRKPMLAELEDRPGVSLEDLVAHVTVHEFAHHFGWSDDDITAIDQWWT